MTGRWSHLRRSGTEVAVAALLLAMGSAAWTAAPAAASCGGMLTFEQTARLPGVTMVTGRAIREAANGWQVVFEVERWFTGPHPARTIRFDGSTVILREPPVAGTIPALTARTISGEAIGLVRGELVFVAAGGADADGLYRPILCAIESPPVASALGREYVAQATAMFGPGLPASRLPATDAVLQRPPAPNGVSWLPVAAFVLAVPALLAGLRRRRRPGTR